MKLKLYHYWRSTSSWRVRWALAYKKIDCEFIAVDLLNGESESAEHLKRHPMGYVPVLEFPDGKKLIESVAMLEWLEETYPASPLLPPDPFQKAQVRSLVELINADTQPLQNLTPQLVLSEFMKSSSVEADGEVRKKWAQHWIQNGLQAYEKLCQKTAGKFSFGDVLTLADLCLVPQCYNAIRFEVPLEQFPTVHKIYQNSTATESYKKSEPDRFKP